MNDVARLPSQPGWQQSERALREAVVSTQLAVDALLVQREQLYLGRSTPAPGRSCSSQASTAASSARVVTSNVCARGFGCVGIDLSAAGTSASAGAAAIASAVPAMIAPLRIDIRAAPSVLVRLGGARRDAWLIQASSLWPLGASRIRSYGLATCALGSG